ncbi:MAG TPA: hypothetical protein VMM18_16750 [Gemmatimonadaceae bacterium]|nr:hypothetical protein [Gemmatimonadaceae bacterium]
MAAHHAQAQHDADHAAHYPMGPAEREVLAVIQRVFDGMRARDTP